MELKQLGNTGVRIPEIGLGVWRYSGGVVPLRRGVELGAFLIDTAEIYGTEEAVAEDNQGHPRSSIHRHQSVGRASSV